MSPERSKSRELYALTCGWCGDLFTTTNRQRKYCCTDHNNRMQYAKWAARRKAREQAQREADFGGRINA